MISGGKTRTIVSISPIAVTMQAGQSRQFIALVTAASSTSVTWSATAGTITGKGLYTAPNVAGIYAVRATSVADPRASASARCHSHRSCRYHGAIDQFRWDFRRHGWRRGRHLDHQRAWRHAGRVWQLHLLLAARPLL